MTDEPTKPPRFRTVEQVAQELNVGIPLIRGLLLSGALRGIQVGAKGVWRIGTADVEAYIEQAYRHTAQRAARGDFKDEEVSDAPS